MTELNVNAENLNAENVESVKAQDDGTTVPVNGQPAIAPQADQNTPVPNQAQGEGQGMTVEELLQKQNDADAQQRIKDNDAEILGEISTQVTQKMEEEQAAVEPVTPPVTEVPAEGTEPEPEAEGDEPGQAFTEQLQKIKNHADTKIQEAEKKAWEADTRLQSEKTLFAAEKAQLEEKIQEMSKELINQKHSSIPSNDESVVRYNYLRQGFLENGDDKKWAQDLGQFHSRYAATYYDVDPMDLNKAILDIKERKNNAKNAAAGGYPSGGGVSRTQRPTHGNRVKFMNRELLS